jgi:hypothetical protein
MPARSVKNKKGTEYKAHTGLYQVGYIHRICEIDEYGPGQNWQLHQGAGAGYQSHHNKKPPADVCKRNVMYQYKISSLSAYRSHHIIYVLGVFEEVNAFVKYKGAKQYTQYICENIGV